MKRFSFIFLILIVSFLCCIAPLKTARADVSSGSLILLLVENHEEDQIDIDVKMVTNTGVSAMTLQLDYDKDVFEFIDYEKGTALEELDLISTNLDDDGNLPIIFNWFKSGGEVKNDESTGVILKLSFKLKDGVQSGKYDIGFKYNKGDVVYIERGIPVAKSVIISKAVISVTDNKISGAEIVEGTNQDGTVKNKTDNGLLIAGIVVFSVATVALVTAIVIKIIKKKRGKGNWSKI